MDLILTTCTNDLVSKHVEVVLFLVQFHHSRSRYIGESSTVGDAPAL